MSHVELRSDAIFNRDEDCRSLSVVVKISERCNLTCSYCYFFFGGDESYRQHPPTLKLTTAEALVAFLRDGAQQYGLERINISLHGGEPLLMKKPVLDQICETIRRGLDGVCEFRLVMQTNGVLIDEEWIALFSRHRIQVGVSFDGDQELHDVHRLDKKGRGTYAQSRRGWDLLIAAADERRIVRPGILCVVDPKGDGARIFDHFARELGCRNLNFLLPDVCYSDAPEPDFIDGCGRYLRRVVDAWSAYDPQRVHVRFIREVYFPLLNDRQALVASRLRNDSLQLLVVRSNGDISPVDKIATASPTLHSTRLNVASTSLPEVVKSPAWAEMIEASDRLPTVCETCTWKTVCRGGPLNTRYSEARGFDNPSVYCPALKSVYAHITQGLAAAGASVDEMERRLARPDTTAAAVEAPGQVLAEAAQPV